jgi:hypothetical protein
MAVSVPTPSQLREVAGEVGLDLSDSDVTSFIELMRSSIAAYNVVDAMPDNLPAVRYPRTPGYRPMGEENAHNAWYVKTKVEGAPTGKLKGKTVVLKDNIMLAGVPMMNGSGRSSVSSTACVTGKHSPRISPRSGERIGSSMPSRPSPAPRRCSPISPATPTASPSPTAA